MYPGQHAIQNSHKPAFIMASSGETVTYGELEQRSNRLAHLLPQQMGKSVAALLQFAISDRLAT